MFVYIEQRLALQGLLMSKIVYEENILILVGSQESWDFITCRATSEQQAVSGEAGKLGHEDQRGVEDILQGLGVTEGSNENDHKDTNRKIVKKILRGY